MNFHKSSAEIIIPDGAGQNSALVDITHMGIGAHPDDIEIIAIEGILSCFRSTKRNFCGVTMTSGGGSPRGGPYENVTDTQMRSIRKNEQKKAAIIGEYSAQIMLNYSGEEIQTTGSEPVICDIVTILDKTRPDIIYTHNLADKHSTHVATCLRVIEALRRLSPRYQPKRLLGCEVWRSLDWLVGSDKIMLDSSHKENLSTALLGVHDSQISGGKRYDLAVQGRNRANATFSEAFEVDSCQSASIAMDMMELVGDESIDPVTWIRKKIRALENDVLERINTCL